MDGQEWLDDYRQRVHDIRARAQRAQTELARIEATAASRDGAVSVIAGPGGVVRRIVFSERCESLSRTQLGALTVDIVAQAQAQAQAARLAVEAVEPLMGADSEAVRVLRAGAS